jgi:preprotein translocase subunit SecE
MATKKTVKRIKLSGGKAIVQDDVVVEVGNTQDDAISKSSKRAGKRPSGKSLLLPITGPAGYFKGSWQELRQVRWPSRRSTWGLTLAVILFTLFFVLVILVLDAAFQFLFKEVLLK